MGTASKKIKMLLVARDMTLTDLAKKLMTSQQNMSNKLQSDNFTEKDIQKIAIACDAKYEINFILEDTGQKI